MAKRLLLLSNSTNAGEPFLDWPKSYIEKFLSHDKDCILFFPFAGVTNSWDEYTKEVSDVFDSIGIQIESIHEVKDELKAISEASAIAVGGGNTFSLLKELQSRRMIDPIRKRVESGIPYLGWSAGANIAAPSIKTTNDMPIVQPSSFEALNLIPFQINPHYLDANPEGHGGETRQQRLEEFVRANPGVRVIGLREGTGLLIDDGFVKLIGSKPARIFISNSDPHDVTTEYFDLEL